MCLMMLEWKWELLIKTLAMEKNFQKNKSRRRSNEFVVIKYKLETDVGSTTKHCETSQISC